MDITPDRLGEPSHYLHVKRRNSLLVQHMRIAFYEDSNVSQLGTIALMRPVFELVCGHSSLRERLIRHLDVPQWGTIIREVLVETYHESQPECRINDLDWLNEDATLLLNGRWLADPALLVNLGPDEVAVCGKTIVAITLEPDEASCLSEGRLEEGIEQIARTRRPVAVDGPLLERPWDLINENPRQIELDFQRRKFGGQSSDFGPHVALVGPASALHVDRRATVDPFVVLDTRKGPISIDAGAAIHSFTQLEGPCHIGRETELFRAHIRPGTTIGPVCRVGGEIENAILHGYANKYHTGFLGHSYVCPWVNLGALSTNSDLKNDYTEVRVPISGEPIKTGMMKVGCFIGDHTKTALASMFNSGSSIGVMCLILPSGELLPKHIPSFTRIWHGDIVESPDLNKLFETARVVMDRRNCELTVAQERLLRNLFDETRHERLEAIHRHRTKNAALTVR